MTAQIPENLLYQGAQLKLCVEPLELYFQQQGSRPTLPPKSSACWRGYIGSWEIREGKLYLVSITIGKGRPWGEVMGAEELELWEAIDEASGEQVTPETLFPGESLPIFARWFSGILRCAKGDVIDYVHAGYESTFQHEFLIELVNGVVVSEPYTNPSLSVRL